MITIHWDDFRAGRSGFIAIPMDDWDACDGDEACRRALIAKHDADGFYTAKMNAGAW